MYREGNGINDDNVIEVDPSAIVLSDDDEDDDEYNNTSDSDNNSSIFQDDEDEDEADKPLIIDIDEDGNQIDNSVQSEDELAKFDNMSLNILSDDEDDDDGEDNYEEDTGFLNLTDDDDDDDYDSGEVIDVIIDKPENYEVSANQLVTQDKKETQLFKAANKATCIKLKDTMMDSIAVVYTDANKKNLAIVNSQYDEYTRFSKGLDNDAPKFLDRNLCTEARKRLPKFDGTMESAKQIYKSIKNEDLPQDVTGQLFFDFLEKSERTSALDTIETKEATRNRTAYAKELTDSLFETQRLNVRDNIIRMKTEESSLGLVSHVKEIPNGYEFTCSCGHVNKRQGKLFSVVNLKGNTPIETPMFCEKCGKLNLVPKIVLRKVKSKAAEFFSRFQLPKGIKENYDSSRPIMYYPSFKYLEEFEPRVFESSDIIQQDNLVVEFNLDKYKKEFLCRVENLHELEKIDSKSDDKLRIKGIAKILANTANDYEEIKSKALASLCQFFRTSRLEMLSQTYIERLEMPAKYEPIFDTYADKIIDMLNTKSSELKTLDDKRKAFDKYKKEKDLILEYRDAYIKDLINSPEIITLGIPFINTKLSKQDKEDFLSYKPLREAMDYLSDYIIVNHFAENWFSTLKIRSENKAGETVNDRKLQTAKSKIKNLNNPDMHRTLTNFIGYFCDKCKNFRMASTDMIFYNCNDFRLLSRISDIASRILDNDYYIACNKVIDLLNTNREDFNNVGKSYRYARLSVLINQIPKVNLVGGEFKFYFGNIPSYTEEQKNKMLQMRKLKKFSIKLSGNFEEDYEAYSKATVNDNVIYNTEFSKFIDDNAVLLESLKALNSFKDYAEFTVGRDLLFSFSNLTPKDLCLILRINSNIVKLFLNSEYSYEGCSFDYSSLSRDFMYTMDEIDSVKNDVSLTENDFLAIADRYLDYEMKNLKDAPEALELLDKIYNIKER